jgi:hypothetical protein
VAAWIEVGSAEDARSAKFAERALQNRSKWRAARKFKRGTADADKRRAQKKSEETKSGASAECVNSREASGEHAEKQPKRELFFANS